MRRKSGARGAAGTATPDIATPCLSETFRHDPESLDGPPPHYDPLWDEIMHPMRPEVFDSYVTRQRELEKAGRWPEAKDLNTWLLGALMTPRQLYFEEYPPFRLEFVERASRRRRDGSSTKI